MCFGCNGKHRWTFRSNEVSCPNKHRNCVYEHAMKNKEEMAKQRTAGGGTPRGQDTSHIRDDRNYRDGHGDKRTHDDYHSHYSRMNSR